MNFTCPCGFKENIEVQHRVVHHMKQCDAFRGASPLCRLVNQTPMQSLTIQQLLTFRADLQLQMEEVENQLSLRNYHINDKGSLLEYSRFYIQDSNGIETSNIKQDPKTPIISSPPPVEPEIITTFSMLFEEPKPRLLDLIKPAPRARLEEIRLKPPSQHTIVYEPTIEIEPQEKLEIKQEKSAMQVEDDCNQIKCERCQKGFSIVRDQDQYWYIDQCCHMVCRACLTHLIQELFVISQGQVRCPEMACKKYLTTYDVENVVGKDRAEELERKLIMSQNNMVCCVKCKTDFIFTQGQKHELIKDRNGKALGGEALNCFAENRFLCSKKGCNTEQCKQCEVTPFHLGLSCDEYKKNQKQLKCRLCEAPVLDANDALPQALVPICKSEECQTRSKRLCSKRLVCGHFCQGVQNEPKCLPCLNSECVKKSDRNQHDDDYCNVCFTEALKSAPCIRSECGHIYHEECIIKRLETRWFGPRINLNYCTCSLCKQWLVFPHNLIDINTLLLKGTLLMDDIKDQSVQRLEIEGKNKDPQLTDKTSEFYQKPTEYAMAVFCFYECFKCKTPYFGGIKNCQANLENERRNFNQEDLICPECCPITFERKCKKHGNKFIEFKCRFCCSIATWFCGYNLEGIPSGTTHYCDPCHSGQNQNMNQVCKGPAYCPLKVQHAPTGQECALGCALCRQVREKQ